MSASRRFVSLKSIITVCILVLTLLCASTLVMAEDGSSLWLRYVQCSDSQKLGEYRSAATEIVVQDFDVTAAPTIALIRNELKVGLDGLLGQDVPLTAGNVTEITHAGSVVVGTPESSPIINSLNLTESLNPLGDEGYLIKSTTVNGHPVTVIASKGKFGALYGAFAYLRLMQTQKSVKNLAIADKPKIKLRQLDHWETERNYAGGNFIDWNSLPNTLLPRYTVFARACASVGINAFVFNNVNTSSTYLGDAYILKEKALADLFRPYGIKVYLVAPYNSPTKQASASLGGGIVVAKQATADPTVASVADWWNAEVKAIYSQIPDFGGFLVKAGSEGQSGPGDYGKSHSQGANLLARALAPYGGTCLWRSFVYDATVDPDRLARCYKDFHPLDGQFDDNAFVQSKFGPLDFMPRETFNPLFGGLPNTNQAIELQITQEYTGQGKKICYLPLIWQEILYTDTYANGPGTLVGKIVDGTAYGNERTAFVGVANIGSAVNMTGQHFGQANFYAFGRMAWNWTISPQNLADDWARMTWSNDGYAVETIVAMLMGSRESVVDHQEPLGLAHQQSQTSTGDHYTPGPGESGNPPEWYGSYYNKADEAGLGYDRSITGSNFVGQYYEPLRSMWGNIDTCPENLLAWFHHVPWDFKMKSGRIFWDELANRYQIGVHYITNMRAQWDSVQPYVDSDRFTAVKNLLVVNETDAGVWRDTSLNYFGTFSKRPIPDDPMQLSTLTINAVPVNGFSPSGYTYTVKIPYGGGAPVLGAIANDNSLKLTITQATEVPGQGFVKVYSSTTYGDLLAVYTVNFTYDSSLTGIAIDGENLANFNPSTLTYNVKTKFGTIPQVTATSADPSATVTIAQVTSIPGQATVTIAVGGLQTVYTINFAYDASLTSLTVDGAQLANFSPTTMSYTVRTLNSTIPQVAATPFDPAATVTVTQAMANPGQATVTVAVAGLQAVYSVNLVVSPNGVFVESGGKVSIEAEAALVSATDADAFNTQRSSHAWSGVAGTSGTAVQCLPDNGSQWTTNTTPSYLDANAPQLGYGIKFTTAGNYRVWLLVKGPDGAGDSILVGLDDQYKFTKSSGIPTNGVLSWVNAGTINNISAGIHILNLWAREDGLTLDKIYLTTGTETPTGTGDDMSGRQLPGVPTFDAIGNQNVNEGSLLQFAVNAVDSNGAQVSYSVSGLPAGAGFDPATKTFSWTPDFKQAGAYTVSFAASNGAFVIRKNVAITVKDVNQVPVFDAIADKSLNLGQTLEFSVNATDVDNDNITYSVIGLPTGASFNAETKTFSWTPSLGQVGTHTIQFVANDGKVNGSQSVSIIVIATVTDSAALVSEDIPAAMAAGKAYTVHIKVKNSGLSDWSAASGYKLVAVGDGDPFTMISSFPVSDVVASGQEATFTITMKAPTRSGSFTTDWQMVHGSQWIGSAPQLKKVVTVTNGDDTIVIRENIPATMTAGQSYTVRITVRNTGDTSWTAADGYKLGAVGETDPFAVSRIHLDANESVAPGAEKTFTFTMKAPQTAGTYVTDWRMIQERVTWFGPVLVSKEITVKASPVVPSGSTVSSVIQLTELAAEADAAAVVSASVPQRMIAGQSYTVSITVKNTGAETWTAVKGYQLVPLADANLFAAVQGLDAQDNIAPGQEKTFTFTIKAPAKAGTYKLDWQMSQEGVAWLGGKVALDIEVK